MKDIMVRCPFNSSIVCNSIKNSLCDNKCVNHPLCEGNQKYQGSYCPFNNEVMCNGENCDKDCYYHPECEFVADDDDIDYEEAMSDAYDDGYNQGFKKGYLSRMEEENDWCECRELGFLEGMDVGYIDGYRDCLMGKPCFIESEEIELLQKLKKR